MTPRPFERGGGRRRDAFPPLCDRSFAFQIVLAHIGASGTCLLPHRERRVETRSRQIWPDVRPLTFCCAPRSCCLQSQSARPRAVESGMGVGCGSGGRGERGAGQVGMATDRAVPCPKSALLRLPSICGHLDVILLFSRYHLPSHLPSSFFLLIWHIPIASFLPQPNHLFQPASIVTRHAITVCHPQSPPSSRPSFAPPVNTLPFPPPTSFPSTRYPLIWSAIGTTGRRHSLPAS